MRALHWFRSDLRLFDNASLEAACEVADTLTLLFVFDTRLLRSPRQGAPRVRFLRGCVAQLAAELEEHGQRLVVREGDPALHVAEVAREVAAERVCWNRDYSPYARARDDRVARALSSEGVEVHTHKDRVVFESDEVRTKQGRPFAVYTPYKNAWWQRLGAVPLAAAQPVSLPAAAPPADPGRVPDEAELGLERDGTAIPVPGAAVARERLEHFLAQRAEAYGELRDFPARDATSRLSPYLRFGALSVRECFRQGLARAERRPKRSEGVRKWLDELVWREFYHAVLAEHPRVLGGAYREAYDTLVWDDREDRFEAWCRGETGYPLVDAGMRELLATGFMHNRVRMVVASFLTKDLLIDWRRGERWFMERLVDGDPANNNGGWQWSASTGTDAQPYFRIFNPVSQSERFDPDGEYIRRWVPELAGATGKLVHRPWDSPLETHGYPPRIVDHAVQRGEALARYQAARGDA